MGFGFIFLAAMLIHVFNLRMAQWHPSRDLTPEETISIQILVVSAAMCLAVGLREVLPPMLAELSRIKFGQAHLNSFKAPDIQIPGSVPR